jgi:hypothetical protein
MIEKGVGLAFRNMVAHAFTSYEVQEGQRERRTRLGLLAVGWLPAADNLQRHSLSSVPSAFFPARWPRK